MRWHRLVDSTSLSPSEVTGIDVDDTELVVWRTAAGEPCVMSGRCPHQWSHFAGEGAVDGEHLVCTSHWWRFDTTGAGTILRTSGDHEPTAPIETYPCAERDGAVWVQLP